MEDKQKQEDVFLSALLRGNRIECQEIMKEFRKTNPSIIELYEELFMKSLYKVGDLWEYNKVSVIIEHMATSITEGLMNDLFPEVMSLERKNKKIVIACVQNEEHQVGGKMVADIFEKNSWDTFYLGDNTPTVELVKYCDLIKPDLIGLSISIYSNIPFLIDEINSLRTVTNIPIIIGGQALIKVGVEITEKFQDVFYFANLESVENYIKGCA